ncbi:RagB/SusD family nutrient uptake outer membrane protein [Pedobacter sp. MC2016-14]|uniref:RagB/SusD family nutrient uptake outer membrane protein n=1 Tax=Pedobacter sp. MC2016-14 TaxID=2897327 RepID=UPI001E61B4CB|nr:RagB/SusD family nutrient uptake outer membrane protein [Pedobacter sp. MC2016-14]MCD0489187.1 RagB/SusD family nutrient uptake outer membrane protein [Pedobacter sp. MC2016-14]
MKRTVLIMMAILSVLNFSSCEKYTDILTPKGKNLLSTVDELEYLLNYNFGASNAFYLQNLYLIDNDIYPRLGNVANTLSGPKTLNYAMLTYDETVDRAMLATSDPSYLEMYSVITNRLNVVIQLVEGAPGNREKATRLKAEALILRAYLHYIIVNEYAKAYNPATAEQDGGIAYMNNIDYETSPVKNTVAQVYAKMLEDVNAALSLGALPDLPPNSTKVSKAFAYAVKAQILISMRDYTGALAAADTSLAFKNTLEDHRPFVATGIAARPAYTASDNLYYATNSQNLPTNMVATVEILNNYFEPGNIMRYYTTCYSFTSGGVNYSQTNALLYGIPGSLLFYSAEYQQNNAGMTVSDPMFIKAECLIRTGKITEGMELINYIRQRRIRPVDYIALTATTEPAAMAHLKKLSRIEFLYTWKNFVNIKRWNTEAAYKETITRTISGITYTLRPESPIWILPFPKMATDYNSNLTQNF